MYFRRKSQNQTDARLIKLLDNLSTRVELLEKKPSVFEKITYFASSWAQVLMLLVVIFGYVYTVIPVVQKEKISEDLANLELEQKSWSSKLTTLNSELGALNSEIERLTSEKNNLASTLIELKKSEENLNTQRIETQRELAYKNNTLLTTNKQLAKAKSELFAYQKRRLLGSEPIPRNYLDALNNSYGIGADFKIAFDLNAKDLTLKTINVGAQLDAVKSGAIMLDDLAEVAKKSKGVDKNVRMEIVKDYKFGLVKNHELLVCPVINPDEWYTMFLASERLIPRLTERCLDITGKANCKFSVTQEIGSVLLERWNSLTDPCRQRILKLNQIVLDNISENDLPRFIDVTPPSRDFIEQKVIETLKLQ